jgi:S-adenosyl-L-methionine hydrolase (adenosine-forming)
MNPIVTLTTDFGFGSYVAQMKAVLLGYRRDLQLVDIAHDIPPQDIFQAATLLADVSTRFPEGTLHLVVVDPGVGTDRKLLYIEAGQWRYILPDNGLISIVAEQWPVQRAIHLTRSRFWAPSVATTFHGRDIIAHVAGHLLQAIDPLDLGDVVERIVELPIEKPRLGGQSLEGKVIAIDHFGNLISNISKANLAEFCRLHRVMSAETKVVIYGVDADPIWSDTYGTQVDGRLIAIWDSQDRLEIARVNANAARFLNLPVGTRIEVVVRSNSC